MDCKRNVDIELKKACEHLICSATESVVSYLTSFNAKVEVFTKFGEEHGENASLLKNQPFAVPKKVNEMFLILELNYLNEH